MVDKKIMYSVVAIVIVVAIFFFTGSSSDSSTGLGGEVVQSEPAGAWVDIELKDVRTGESFRISDFSGTPVLLESFAVWCPTCTRQQKITRDFDEEVGDSVISVSIDTDPNEDESRVLQHVQSNGFNWRYAISPVDLTRSLIDQFGVGVVNAPSVPMILICEDGSVRKLSSGVKSVSKLKEEIKRGC